MNVDSLIEEFRDRTLDLVEPYAWSDEYLVKCLAEAETEAAIRAGLFRDSTTLDVGSGEIVISIPQSLGLFEIKYCELIVLGEEEGEKIDAVTYDALDEATPGWRRKSGRPEAYVHDGVNIVLGAKADQDYQLFIEYSRTPKNKLVAGGAPEIGDETQHIKLIDWAEYRAYSQPDTDFMNPNRAQSALAEFERNFGKRPNADMKRKQNANKPHRNRCHL